MTHANDSRPTKRRPISSRWKWAAITVFLLAILVSLVTPRRLQQIVTVDGQSRWNEDNAPLRRSIVWQPPERWDVALQPGVADGAVSLGRPVLADGGSTLYLTVRTSDGSTDVFSSRLASGKWSPALPVAELNSVNDDVGPVISADGRELFMYSDRPGGEGGFDIYVSTRTADGWSEPRNLGPTVNTSAHEFDPAITPDGKQLFFASNRTEAMQAAAADVAEQSKENRWSATLRSPQGLQFFDLFVARREPRAKTPGAADWQIAARVAGANLRDSNDGAPFVSPQGVFLYFASDRESRPNEPRNFDLYRGRLDGATLRDVENLGPGVNTPANEIEPALSPEGYRIVFSSDRGDGAAAAAAETPATASVAKAAAEKYSLFSSVAIETYEDQAWSQAPIQALLLWLADNFWWIILGLLIAALIAALLWYLREVSLRRAPVPGFFLIALIFHLLLGVSTFYVYLGDAVAKKVKQVWQEITVAANLPDPHQSHQPGLEEYEKVADLQSVEAVKVSEVERQVTEAANIPVPVDSPIPTLPMTVSRDPLNDPQLPPKVEVETPKETVVMERQKAQPLEVAMEAVPLEQTAEPQPAPAKPPETQVAVQVAAPQAAARPIDVSVPMQRRTRSVESRLEPIETLPDARPTTAPPETSATESAKIARAANKPAEMQETATVALEAVAAAKPPTAESAAPAKTQVTVARQAESAVETQVALANVAPTRATPLAAKIQADAADAAPARSEVAPAASQPAAAPTLARSQPAPAANPAAQAVAVALEAVNAPAAVAPAELPTTGVEVQLARTQTASPDARATGATVATNSQATISQAVHLEIAKEESAAATAAAPATQVEPAKLTRAALTKPPVELSGEVIALANPTPAAETAVKSGDVHPAAVAVQVARAETAAPIGPMALPAATSTATTSTAAKPAASAADMAVRSDAASPASAAATATAPTLTRRGAKAPDANVAIDNAAVALEAVAAAQSGDPAGANAAVAKVEVGITGSRSTAVDVRLASADDIGGWQRPRNPNLVIGTLANEANNAPVSFDPVASQLTRRAARAPSLLYAEDNIGLQSMLRLRGADTEMKKDLVQAFGGNEATLDAIRRGLEWLAKHQAEDGHWGLNEFFNQAAGEKISGAGSIKSDTAGTGLALLPFLGDGHTHVNGQYQATVQKGLNWLVSHQKPDGDLYVGGSSTARMYSHGIAAIALCEAYGMSKDPALLEPAQKALDFIVAAQHSAGGWRYEPKQPGDTSVVGWQIMAIKSGQMAGLKVPETTLAQARAFLQSVAGKDKNLGRFGYQDRSAKPEMTAEALLCLEYLGSERTDPQLQGGANYLLTHLPSKGKDSSYYLYYGTQVMYHMQGDFWQKWNAALNPLLIESQLKDGVLAGTWNPSDNWENQGGRIYTTSLRLLMLEVYYRHLPLYQALEQ